MAKKYEISGLEVKAVKNFYTGLWEVRYVDGGAVWSGPYRTKREAVDRIERHIGE